MAEQTDLLAKSIAKYFVVLSLVDGKKLLIGVFTSHARVVILP